MSTHGQRSTASQCPNCGRAHGETAPVGRSVLSDVGLGEAVGAIGGLRGRCCRSSAWRAWRVGCATNGGGAAGERPHFGRACVHGCWNMCWMARTTWKTGRTRRPRTRRWSSLTMPMKMLSKAVGRPGSRRFAIAAAGAACRWKTFCILMLVRAEDGHTTARWSTITTSDRELRRVCVVFLLPCCCVWLGEPAGLLSSQQNSKEVPSEAGICCAIAGRDLGNGLGAVRKGSVPGVSLQTPARSANGQHKKITKRCCKNASNQGRMEMSSFCPSLRHWVATRSGNDRGLGRQFSG